LSPLEGLETFRMAAPSLALSPHSTDTAMSM
jgi:hypothetical protein